MIKAKSGSKWTANELDYFNIVVSNVDRFRNFFGIEPAELPETVRTFVNIDLKRCVRQLYAATRLNINAESSVNDFAVKVLELCEHDDGGRTVGTRPEIDLLMTGKIKYAKPDAYVHTDNDGIVLLVQEDKNWRTRSTKIRDVEAQVIAEAIAAYQYNRNKDMLAHRPEVLEQQFPCIVMFGAYPMFYLITVTNMLSQAVASGSKPSVPTEVKKFSIPPIEGIIGDTLYDREKRLRIMQAYIAFKRFL
ncbi:hypothetical protein CONCODRAFT_71370 [Conidiobolus coronatus NRRL 28638]|uniref:Uncharacterized protein n=1 Tax=Conidiobolus coronatus (strain ATCC 28846 / CBS 209.66 / NRRL 28638) TaxID=796925 RepID=A0A137P3J6_CONC2|nr:hypothetical protein CONCODRAFT_71370 [Conidiobolus coronatus NRRL 28638]|eukprot:KXN69568.1 hypothetical protein CONCODRAFT_71370 [Conidiobolus coronatus NRRL 28638]